MSKKKLVKTVRKLRKSLAKARRGNHTIKRKVKKRTYKRYKTRRNEIFAPVRSTSQVQNKTKFKTLRIEHKEFVQDLTSAQDAMHFQKIEINPGLSETFPWVSNIAQAFESFRFKELRFEFISNVGTDTGGTVCLAPDYDPSDDDSTLTKAEILSFDDCKRGAIWGGMVMRCDPKNLNKRTSYFVRHGPVLDSYKLYDPLQLVIYTNDSEVSLGSVYGELWVHYVIEFETPQLQTLPSEFAIIKASAGGGGSTRYPIIGTPTVNENVGVFLKLATDYFGLTEPGKYLMHTVGVSDQTTNPTTFVYTNVPAEKISGTGDVVVTQTGPNDGSVGFDNNTVTSTEAYLDNVDLISVTGAVTKDDPVYMYPSMMHNYTSSTYTNCDNEYLVQKISDTMYQTIYDNFGTISKKNFGPWKALTKVPTIRIRKRVAKLNDIMLRSVETEKWKKKMANWEMPKSKEMSLEEALKTGPKTRPPVMVAKYRSERDSKGELTAIIDERKQEHVRTPVRKPKPKVQITPLVIPKGMSLPEFPTLTPLEDDVAGAQLMGILKEVEKDVIRSLKEHNTLKDRNEKWRARMDVILSQKIAVKRAKMLCAAGMVIQAQQFCKSFLVTGSD